MIHQLVLCVHSRESSRLVFAQSMIREKEEFIRMVKKGQCIFLSCVVNDKTLLNDTEIESAIFFIKFSILLPKSSASRVK